MEDADEVLLSIINQLNRSLDYPNYVNSSGVHNNKQHLLNVFDLEENGSNENNDEIILNEWTDLKPTPDILSGSDRNSSKVPSIQQLKQKSCSSSNQPYFKSSSKALTGIDINAENTSSDLILVDLPLLNSENSQTTVGSEDLKAAQNEIEQLENCRPARMAHMSPLSRVLNTRIAIWTSSMNFYGEAGTSLSGEALNVQHDAQPNENLWTLKSDEDPPEFGNDLNSCLFNAIASQAGCDPLELSADTVNMMENHIKSFVNRIKGSAKENEYSRIVLMVECARYIGNNKKDAKEILDNSQAETSHPGHLKGHPRGHASNPSAKDPKGSAENYSKNGWKTGFLNQDDQDRALHDVLRTPKAKAAMEALNEGETSKALHISASAVKNPPQAANFNDGVQGSVHPIKEYVIVLRHFSGHSKDPDYNVFVHTFYPVLDQTEPAKKSNN